MAARGEAQANVEVSTLVVPAWMLRWRAPELALVLGERALALAASRHDEADRLRAESLVVFAGNRVGRSVRIADRAIDALKAAEAAGEHETAWLLRVELAACARSVGAPLTGFAAVTPVLEAPDVPAELRASALVQASECLVTVGRGDEPTQALAEADQLYVADSTLDEDTRLLLRGLIRAVQAAQHRRWGDIAAAIGAAREGLDLLGRFSDPAADSGQGLGRLTLELVLSLMDANRLLDASDVGTPMLDRPVRAPSASTSGWLRLALATRVHLPAGRVALAREMLREAAASAERHQLDTLLAESLLALAHVHEVSGELADALTNLRTAHAAERRRARAVYAVRARLAAEFSGVHRQPADLHQQLASLLRPVEGMQVVTDGILSAALKQQLRQWRPVQVRKGDGLKVKRVQRAAEDMSVEGLSAARQHAADRWRMVQPFGEPDDKTPEPVELPPASLPSSPSSSPSSSSDRTVPASGLIASAGAMVSGRRRAARVAAGEIDDDQPTTVSDTTPVAPEPSAAQPQSPQEHSPQDQSAQPPLTVEQERKRKVEQQLMELQREARRQIEAERQARAEQRAQAEREAQAAEEAARQEAAREEAARQEAARQESARQESVRQEAARQQAARQELARQEAARQEAVRQEEARREAARQEAVRRDVARQEAAHQEVARQAVEREEAARETARPEIAARDDASRSQSESVLDMLKAQGLRAGGRRRARDAEPEPAAETPSWRVEPPSRLREDAPAPQAPPQNFLADSAPAPSDRPARQDYFADSAPLDRVGRQDFFADSDSALPDRASRQDYFADPTPPTSPDMPDHPTRSGLSAAFSHPPAAPDFGPHLDEPSYPLHTPAGGSPATADPDERKLPDLDFSSLDFSTSKAQQPAEPPDQEPDLEHQPLPTPEPDLLSSSFLSSADVDDDASDVPTVPVRMQAQTEPARPTFGTQTSFGTQPSFGTQTFGTQTGFGTQSGFGTQPDSASQYDFFATQPESPAEADPAVQTELDHAAAESTPATPPVGEPTADTPSTDSTSEPADRTGRPSSRRKPSDLSLADLLAEALVAYETGRRSDEEQFEASDLSAPHWSADEPGPEPPASFAPEPFAAEQPPTEAEPPAGTDFLFRPRESFGAPQEDAPQTPFAPEPPAAEQSYLPDRPTESEPPVGTDFLFRPDQPFGAPQESAVEASPSSDTLFRLDRPFGAEQESTEAQPASDALFRSSQFGGHQDSAVEAPPSSDALFQPGQSFGSQQPPADSAFHATQPSFGSPESFGSPQPSFGSPQPSFGSPQSSAAEGAPSSESYFLPKPSAESEQEKTGPIVPVGAAPDSETTGPIRRVQPDGPAGWTLPGT